MSAERLDEIRAILRGEQTFDWDYPFDDAADDLLTEVDRLTAENARLRKAVDDAVDYCNDPSTWPTTLPGSPA